MFRLPVLAASWLLLAGFPAPTSAQTYDVVIANGRVIDPESGLDAVRHVGIRNDRIAALSETPLTGVTTIDARGLIVAPGFIDLHRHGHGPNSDRYVVRDGITSALELEVGTADVEAWYRGWAAGRLVNYGVAAGHIPTRMRVMGDSGEFLPSGPARSQATVGEMMEVVRLMDSGLAQGAVAVGMGLAYTPEASAMEVLQVFRSAAKHGAAVHVHLRGGMSGLVEAIGMAATTGAPLQVVETFQMYRAQGGAVRRHHRLRRRARDRSGDLRECGSVLGGDPARPGERRHGTSERWDRRGYTPGPPDPSRAGSAIACGTNAAGAP